MPRVRIFQVAYDPSLLRVRAEMLNHAGFQVSSALGNIQARRELLANNEYDLVVVGWSTDDGARREMVCWVKQHFPYLRVIALYGTGGHQISEADFNSNSENPEDWFLAVKRAAIAS